MEGQRRVIVVGGGIAGLSAAWSLCEEYAVTVIEAAPQLGGKIASTSFRNRPLDLGADAFIVRNPAALDLCHELGLTAELIEPSTKSAAIYARRELHPFPTGLSFGVPTNLRSLHRSGIVGPIGVLRALRDYLTLAPVLRADDLVEMERGELDPTIAEIFTKPLGPRVVSALIDPLVGGINASDAERLSFYGSMPQIVERIVGKRSIMRALRRPEKLETTETGSIFRGLRDGMYTLIRTLEERLLAEQVAIVKQEQVHDVTRDGRGGFTLTTSATTRHADYIVLATPAYVSAELVRRASPQLAHELNAIPYASVATVTMSFPETSVPPFVAHDLADLIASRGPDELTPPSEHLLPGSGVLVARSTAAMTTATSFISTKWPRSGAPGEVVIRSSLGRHNDERAMARNDEELLTATREELSEFLGIHADPLDAVIQRWPSSFPQYVSGHHARVERIDRLARGLEIDLVGAAYHGIGIPACIAHARRAAQRLAVL